MMYVSCYRAEWGAPHARSSTAQLMMGGAEIMLMSFKPPTLSFLFKNLSLCPIVLFFFCRPALAYDDSQALT